MADEIDMLDAMAGRVTSAAAALFCAGCAEFLLPLYEPYDGATGARYSVLKEQLEMIWARLASVEGSAELIDPQDLADRTAPDVDVDRSPHAPLAQYAALAVVYATQSVQAPRPDTVRSAFEQVEMAAMELCEAEEDADAYTRGLEALRGLPTDVIKERIDQLNRRLPGTRRRRAVLRAVKALGRALEKMVARGSVMPRQVTQFRKVVSASALRP